MPSSLRAVLFDLDGTLLDTAPDFSRLINLMRKNRQLPPFPYQQLRDVVSDGAAGMIRSGFADYLTPNIDGPEEELEALKAEFLNLYQQSPFVDSHPFPGISNLIDWLESHQLRWGIVTNKPWKFTEIILQQLDWLHDDVPVYCPDHVSESKPHPEGLLRAASDLALTPNSCLYAGDHRRDTEAGRRAGMRTVACLYGYIDKTQNQDWPTDFRVDSSLELQPLVESLVS